MKKIQNFFINIYLKIMFFALPRLIMATSYSIESARKEAANLPQGLKFSMQIMQDNKGFGVEVKEGGFFALVKSSNFRKFKQDKNPVDFDIKIKFKHKKYAFLVLAFIEGTAEAFAKARMVADGSLPHSLIMIRILNTLEANVLPKFIAKRILKEYPQDLGFFKKIGNATKIIGHFLRISLGGK